MEIAGVEDDARRVLLDVESERVLGGVERLNTGKTYLILTSPSNLRASKSVLIVTS